MCLGVTLAGKSATFYLFQLPYMSCNQAEAGGVLQHPTLWNRARIHVEDPMICVTVEHMVLYRLRLIAGITTAYQVPSIYTG